MSSLSDGEQQQDELLVLASMFPEFQSGQDGIHSVRKRWSVFPFRLAISLSPSDLLVVFFVAVLLFCFVIQLV